MVNFFEQKLSYFLKKKVREKKTKNLTGPLQHAMLKKRHTFKKKKKNKQNKNKSAIKIIKNKLQIKKKIRKNGPTKRPGRTVRPVQTIPCSHGARPRNFYHKTNGRDKLHPKIR